MNAALKRVAERSLTAGGVAAAARALRRGDALVLAYHGILPHGTPPGGEHSLHLPQREFARQLDALRRTHDVIPLDALEQPRAGGRPRIAITFDDAYAGAVTAGVDELARRGLPATYFVAPGLLGRVPWWDALARGGVLDADVRRHAIEVLGGRDEAVRRWADRRDAVPNPRAPRIATEGELAAAARVPGIALGAHSWSHPDLRARDADDLADELARPLRWLRERFDCAAPWLAYPYGLASESVQGAAGEAGYRGAFRVDGGWMPRPPAGIHPHALPRMNVPAGLSLDGFRLRISGVTGVGG
jgi:peptidoglycan/xylan/chitin deacetylase (PgdA/CDA1 family)